MRVFLASLLCLSIFIGNTPKAEAVVAIAIKNRTVRTVGGVVTAAGVSGFTISAIVANVTGSYSAIGLMILSVPVAIVGLVILDEKNADLKFSQLPLKKARVLAVSPEDIAIYNTEVEELNVVKETIESRVSDKSTQADIDYLWSEYKDTLSPETLKVAAQVTIKVLTQK
jgi:hypothetical protein